MRLLSKLSFATMLFICATYIYLCLPIVNENAARFGSGFVWAWLLVTLPITLRFWCFPLTFGRTAFKIIYLASLQPTEETDERAPAPGRRIAAVLVMMLGFFVSGQFVLHFIIEPAMNAFLDKASLADAGGAALLAVWCYVLAFFSVKFVYPFVMALFMVVSKTLAPDATNFLAYQWRGYVRGIYPFMSWVFQG